MWKPRATNSPTPSLRPGRITGVIERTGRLTLHSRAIAICFFLALVSRSAFAITVFELDPVADTYVESGEKAHLSFEGHDQMAVKNISGTSVRESYLRFDLSGFSGITGATLKLQITENDSGPVTQRVEWEDNDNWRESMSWNERPGIDTGLFTERTLTGVGSVSFDVTRQVQADGDGLLSLRIHATETGKFVSYASRDHSSAGFRPVLEIVTGGDGPAVVSTPQFSPSAGNYNDNVTVTLSTQTSGATIYYTDDGSVPNAGSDAYGGGIAITATTTIKAIAMVDGLQSSEISSATYIIANASPDGAHELGPVADTYVESGEKAHLSFEGHDQMAVKNISGTSVRESYLRFDLSGFSGITSATLKLQITENDSGPVTQRVEWEDNDNWRESMSWNERPGIDTALFTERTLTGVGPVSFDVTRQVQADGDGLLSLRIHATEKGKFVSYASRDHSSAGFRPVLVIAYTADPDPRTDPEPEPDPQPNPGPDPEPEPQPSPEPNFDTDNDGLDDRWERDNFNGSLSQDGQGDPDGDGLSNMAEYVNGSDPHRANHSPVPKPGNDPERQGKIVGAMAGDLSVQNGALGYSVPITVPRSVGGLQPGISAVYNSQGGGGLLGSGWSLAGFSSITRCGQTLAQDGTRIDVDLTDTDRFCLDGQRLMGIVGRYGFNGTTYKTEIDTFAKIVSHDRKGNGPAYFTVENRGGQKFSYNKQILAQGKSSVYVWALEKISDSFGNEMEFEYEVIAANTEFYPTKIKYGKNTRSGRGHYASVEFEYETRKDDYESRLAGSKIKQTRRLKEIRTFLQTESNSPKLIYTYYFDYKVRSKDHYPSMLNRIQQCDANGDCLPATKFGWRERNNDLVLGLSATAHTWTSATTAPNCRVQDPGWIEGQDPENRRYIWKRCVPTIKVGDIDRDGMDDIRLDYGLGSIYAKSEFGGSSNTFSNPTGSWDGAQMYIPGNRQDVNGDGYNDTVVVGRDVFGDGEEPTATGKVSVTLSTSDGTGTKAPKSWGDLGSLCRRGVSTCPFQLADINGDGLADVVARGRVYYSTGTKFSQRDLDEQLLSGFEEARFGDVNGDGRMDAVTPDIDSKGRYRIRVNLSIQAEHEYIDKITSGKDVVTEIVYKNLTDPIVHTIWNKPSHAPATTIPVRTPIPLVYETKAGNGVGGITTTRYHYKHYKSQLEGRGPLGFEAITVADVKTGSYSVTSYKQDWPHIGSVLSVEQYLGNDTNVLRIDNTYGSKEIAQSSVFPYLAETTETGYDINGRALSTSTTQNLNYDDYGNVGKVIVRLFDDEDTTGRWTVTTTNTYKSGDDNRWRGQIDKTTVEHAAHGESSITKTAQFNYFTSGASKGLIKQEITEPKSNDKTIKKTVSYQYDAWGNRSEARISGIHSSANAAATGVPSSLPDRVTRTTVSLPIRLRVPHKKVVIVNAAGHSETRIYDLASGNLIEQTGPNGLTTTWVYDTFGRKVREIRPDGTMTTWSRYWASGQDYKPGLAHMLITENSSGVAEVKTFRDKMGRDIRTITRAFRSEGNQSARVFVDSVYNDKGQLGSITRPYFQGETKYEIGYKYDPLGRERERKDPGPGSTEVKTVTTHNRFTTTTVVTNPSGDHGQHIIGVKNARGDLLRVTEAFGSPDQATLNYTYTADGKLRSTVDPLGAATILEYDILGRKTHMQDPAMGVWSYRYNTVGELDWQKDAKNNKTGIHHDKLGRMVKRKEAGVVTGEWKYDEGGHGKSKGKLTRVSGTGYGRSIDYDNFGRVSSTTTTIDGTQYVHSIRYDQYSRVASNTRPGGFRTSNIYNANGVLTKITSPANTRPGDGEIVWWKLEKADAEGRVTQVRNGNGLKTWRNYNPRNGQLNGIDTGKSKNDRVVQSISYLYDGLNNVRERRDNVVNRVEDFGYDAMQRLTGQDMIVGGTTLRNSWDYDNAGNITSRVENKIDIGYAYQNVDGYQKLTAAGAIGGIRYDNNGNIVNSDDRSIDWSSFNKPSRINTGNHRIQFKYGPNRARYERKNFRRVNGLLKIDSTTHYLGKGFERNQSFDPGGELTSTEHLYFIYVGDNLVATHSKSLSNTKVSSYKQRYYHTDALGSISAITDESGNVVDRYMYSVFGERSRDADGPISEISHLSAYNFSRGYTGHQELADVGFVHMNGRVYDPMVGRFLSADPSIQAPTSTQNYNRYSYVINNPLKYTDPSGYSFFGSLLQNIFKPVATFARKYGRVVVGGLMMSIPGGQGLGASIVFGFTSGFVLSGGDLQAGLAGAFTAGTFYGVGQAFKNVAAGFNPGKILAHGVVGGASASLQGGSFKDGFVGAAVSQGVFQGAEANGYTFDANADTFASRIKNAAIAGMIGGTSAVLAGGKFRHAAVSAAMGRLFNDLSSNHRHKNGETKTKIDDKNPIKRTVEEEAIGPYSLITDRVEYLSAWAGLKRFSVFTAMESIDHLAGSTRYDLVEYTFERVVTKEYQGNYYRHPDGEIGYSYSWTVISVREGLLLNRQVIRSYWRDNLSGAPPNVYFSN